MENMPPSKPEQEPALTFEEFTKKSGGHAYYNNFIAPFMGEGIATSIYKNLPHNKRFAAENPELYESISRQIQAADPTTEHGWSGKLESVEPELYEAYLIMKEYGLSDEELFA